MGRYDTETVVKATTWFDNLWSEASPFDLASFFEEAFEPKTPFEIFLRVLWELYGDEVEQDLEVDKGLPLTSFQKHGVVRALRLINETGGVIVADEVGLGIEITDMQYFWLTPLENIQSPLIQNLNVSGRKLGDIIALELSRLPQRESWKSYQLNLNVLKSYQLSQSLSVFYDFDYISIDHSKYRALSDIPNSNIKFRSGLKYDFGKMQLSIFGDFYKNNLLGFEPIIVNQRTENYFTQNFGSLGAEILVRF